MWRDILAAIALVLVIEGVLPFLSPTKWREYLISMSQLSDQTVRRIGLLGMLAGVVLLIIVHQLLDSSATPS